MKSKKIFSVFLALLTAAALLAGCAKKTAPADTTGGTAGTDTTGTTAAAGTTATADDVKAALADKSAIVADARSEDAYSGWSTAKYQKGGHIDGATDFSANWLTCTFDDKDNLDGMTREEHLAKYMADKGITASSSVIVYDENGGEAKAVADYLVQKGVKDVKTFDLTGWTDPLVSYANYALYVPPAVVSDLIAGKQVDEIGAVTDLKIVEVSWGKTEESGYLNGHVPGAIHVNSDDFDQEDNYYLLDSDEVLFNLAKSQGITTESTVICTGAPIFSCRYAIILKYLGVKNVYVMSGGVNSWTDAGYTLETAENKPEAAADFGTATPAQPDLIDTVAEVQAKQSDPTFQLVDNRTIEEYRGETSGYSYFELAGRIEGAVYGQAGVGNSSSMLYYDNVDTTMRNADEILAMWQQDGVDTAKHLSFYCGGGYRAAEVTWDSWVMGLSNTSLFADGWCGWAAAGLPSVKGQ
jgi:3-mercaptopyruvate sulfurtransferase SseA